MKLQEVRNMLGNDFEDIISEFKREGGSIIFVVGKSPMDIMEPILL